jgi:hypothetical protein
MATGMDRPLPEADPFAVFARHEKLRTVLPMVPVSPGTVNWSRCPASVSWGGSDALPSFLEALRRDGIINNNAVAPRQFCPLALYYWQSRRLRRLCYKAGED